MATTIGPNSRLRFGDLRDIDGVEFWGILDLPDIPQQDDDIIYTVQGSDRIDVLAHRHYGDEALWWVIAVANDMEILPTDLNEGEQIRIPSPAYISQLLFTNAVVQ
jgi:hypothetical protein